MIERILKFLSRPFGEFVRDLFFPQKWVNVSVRWTGPALVNPVPELRRKIEEVLGFGCRSLEFSWPGWVNTSVCCRIESGKDYGLIGFSMVPPFDDDLIPEYRFCQEYDLIMDTLYRRADVLVRKVA